MTFDLIKKGGALCFSFFYVTQACYAYDSVTLEFGTSVQRVSYTEGSSSSQPLNKESGLLPGLVLGAKVANQKTSVFAKAYLSKATIDYKGQTQSSRDLQTTTNTFRSEYIVGVAYQLDYWARVSLAASRYDWDRKINGTDNSLPLDEYYQWKIAKLGLKIRLFKGNADQLNLGITYGKLFGESLKVDLSDLGYGQPSIPLNGRAYEQFGLNHIHQWTAKTQLKFDITYTNLEFDQSPSINANNGFRSISIREPASKTELIELALTISQKF